MSQPFSNTGPHIHSRDNVSGIMVTVVLALLPAVVAACWLFGPWALYPILATALGSALLEWLLIRHRSGHGRLWGDGSALVAGLILGLSLAPGGAWWVPLMGALILVTIGKQVFGGLGYNVFNPALVARAVLLLAWPETLTAWITPFDGLSTATPLAGLETNYLDLFLGRVPGSLGETSAVAILLGAGLLVAREIISWKVPVMVLVGAVVAAVMFGVDPLMTVLSGSLLFAAVFMATDMVTSPTGKSARLVFAFGCGWLTVFLRVYTYYPEGVTFAILFMNGFAYLFDRLGADPIFGRVEEQHRQRRRRLLVPLLALAVAVILTLGWQAHSLVVRHFGEPALSRAVRADFPTAERIVDLPSFDAAVRRYRVYQGRHVLGLWAQAEVVGYGGPMTVRVAMDPQGRVSAVSLGAHRESPTLGTRIAEPDFRQRFVGLGPKQHREVSTQVAAISGATVSSRAMVTAVERILGAGTRPQPTGGGLPAAEDGAHSGSGQGYKGPIQVRVTVAGGAVSGITVIAHQETPGIGTRAFDAMIPQIIDQQSLAVDAVSGATASSQGLLSAIEEALQTP